MLVLETLAACVPDLQAHVTRTASGHSSMETPGAVQLVREHGEVFGLAVIVLHRGWVFWDILRRATFGHACASSHTALLFPVR